MNKANTYLKILSYFSITLIIIWVLVWVSIDYIIIPRVITPKIKEYINKNYSASVKLSIKDISFHPFKGFLLTDIKLSGPVVIENDYILYAKEADVDLTIIPLLKRKIEVKLLKISDVHLEISRNEEGKWNFQPLVDIVTVEEHNVGSFSFLIKEFLLESCSLEFIDSFNKDNTLKRMFTDINIVFKKLGKSEYHLLMSGGDPDKSKESVSINLSYNESQETLEGNFVFHTDYLNSYWNYYLDELMSPWELNAESMDLNINLSYIKNILYLDGKYNVNRGSILYGDINIKGNAFINHGLKWVKGEFIKDSLLHVDLLLEDVSASAGEYLFLKNGDCKAIIAKDEITFRDISGLVGESPVSLSGKFTFTEPKELKLNGKIDRFETVFELKILSENSATADWRFNLGNSSLELQLNTDNLEDLEFVFDIKGNIDLIDMFRPELVSENGIKGATEISGNIKGEADKASSLNGQFDLKFRDFSIWGLETLNLNLDSIIENGVFSGNIEKTSFYEGSLNGLAYIDINKWGLGIYIDRLNLEEFAKTIPDLKGIRGIVTVNISNTVKWADPDTIQGGGYFKFQNLSLWDSSLFSKIKVDIENASNISLPANFKLMEGNFRIDKGGFNLENVYCDIERMELDIKGNISSEWMANFTAGIVFSKGGFLRVVRQILVPGTIAFDVIADSIKINIYGKWPHLDHKVEIQPIAAFFNAIFPVSPRGNPDKYTLEKFLKKE